MQVFSDGPRRIQVCLQLIDKYFLDIMAKRVSFDPIVQEQPNDGNHADQTDDEFLQPFSKKFKHTLDSDEEDDELEDEKYNIMNSNDFDGEEEGTIRREQDVTITPFNMNEELEEGHIDKEGMYVFNKKSDEITDHWLDNIDSVQLKEQGEPKKNEDTMSDDVPSQLTTNECYRKMIVLMKPGETVKRAIQRYGATGKKPLNARSKANVSEEEKKKQDTDKANMLELIAVADQILDAGDMDVYERTFEQLNFRLKEVEELSKSTLDMFADAEAEENETQVSTESNVSWLIKWEDKEDAEVHGPFTNDQMISWTDSGYFEKGAWVRQVGKQDAKFYSTRRIDFELFS